MTGITGYPSNLPSVETVAVNRCPACGGSDSQPHAKGFDYELRTCANEWKVVECGRCGHLWLNPRPAASTLPVIYPADYYAYDYERTVHPIALKGKAWLDRRKLDGIIGDLQRQPKSFLDVGCGTGRYLHTVRSMGLDPAEIYGLELDQSTVERLQGEGFQAYCERVEVSESLPAGHMDLITMFHVIEHVDNPALVLARLFELLAPGGCLAIETPNSRSTDHRFFARSLWGGYHFPRHWHVFSTESLVRVLNDAGFEVLTTRYQTGHSFWMYSFHHFFRYRMGWPRVARLFDPLKGLPLLVLFTGLDRLRGLLGLRTSAVLVVARKPG